MITNSDGSSFYGIPCGVAVPLNEQDLIDIAAKEEAWLAQIAIQEELAKLPTKDDLITALYDFALTGDNTKAKAINQKIITFNNLYPDNEVKLGI